MSTSTTLDIALLRTTLFRLVRRLRRTGDAGITPSQLSALGSVDRLGSVALRDLAAVEHVAPPTLTAIVGKLEAEGLVIREADPSDGRVTLVRVTEQGRALLEAGRRRSDAWLTARVEALGRQDRAALERALPVLVALLEEPA